MVGSIANTLRTMLGVADGSERKDFLFCGSWDHEVLRDIEAVKQVIGQAVGLSEAPPS